MAALRLQRSALPTKLQPEATKMAFPAILFFREIAEYTRQHRVAGVRPKWLKQNYTRKALTVFFVKCCRRSYRGGG